MGRNRRNRILLSSTRLSIEPLENRALLAGVTADIPLSNSLDIDTAQVNTDAISSNTTGFPTNISVEAGDEQATVFLMRALYGADCVGKIEILGFNNKASIKERNKLSFLKDSVGFSPVGMAEVLSVYRKFQINF